jgi:hypothetical protein
MTITIELGTSVKSIEAAARAISAIRCSRENMRRLDKEANRKATGYEEEAFADLCLASSILDAVNKGAVRALLNNSK